MVEIQLTDIGRTDAVILCTCCWTLKNEFYALSRKPQLVDMGSADKLVLGTCVCGVYKDEFNTLKRFIKMNSTP